MKNKIFSLVFCLLGILAFIAGIYVIIGGIQRYIEQHEQKDWTIHTAQVTNVSSRVVRSGSRKNRTSRTVYDITYQYEVDGQQFTGEVKTMPNSHMAGESLKIKYDPEHPENSTATLSPQLSDLLVSIGAGIVYGVVGFFLSGLYAWVSRKRRKTESG